MPSAERIVALVDMDCFYVQVEQRRNPTLKGTPCAVVQYNTWQGGGIIAVGYEARAHGVTRQMRGDQAKEKCPAIQLVRVPENRGKADLTRYREAGAEVITVLTQFSGCVERASIDEAYVDLTEAVHLRLAQMAGEPVSVDMLPHTYVAGWDGRGAEPEAAERDEGSRDQRQDGGNGPSAVFVTEEDARRTGTFQWLDQLTDIEGKRLAIAAVIVEEMRAAVLQQTKFHCSAGISHNKVLAKLACGLHKPKKQTVVPKQSVERLFKTLPINKIRNLGGKLGRSLTEDLGVEFMGDLCRYTEKQLQAKLGDKTGAWLYGLCRGVDDEPIRARLLPKSVGCGKNFRGKMALDTKQKVKHWISQLAEELTERLVREQDLNNRTAKLLSVHVQQTGNSTTGLSRSCALHHVDASTITKDVFMVIQSLNVAGNQQEAWVPAITSLGMSASKFSEIQTGKSGIKRLDTFLTSVAKMSDDQPCTSSATEDEDGGPDSAGGASPVPDSRQKGSNAGRAPKELPVARKYGIQAFFTPWKDQTHDKRCPVVANSSNCNGTNSGVPQSETESPERAKKRPGKKSGHAFFRNYIQKVIEPTGGDDKMDIHASQCVMLDVHKSKRDGDCIMEHTDMEDSHFDSLANTNSTLGTGDRGTGSGAKEEKIVEKPQTLCVSEHGTTSVASAELNLSPAHDQSEQPPSEVAFDSTNNPSRTPDTVTCDKCNKAVSPWEYPEHLDYHFALELQEQMQGPPRPPGAANNLHSPAGAGALQSLSGSGGGVGGLKRRGKSPRSSNGSKKLKTEASSGTLHSFFKQK
ncbi:DNA polymerase eta-like [Acanthaster planci]|uniref:DNA polymerase eta n=1 Tax=Acanthaster planci TaxID=133434 RepID=A0A8B7YX85_ACAPL|nr:DNA polymerase eta-like [Acanthaster planci]XP_022097297.1 DNA polymerase eta-like [Acanthaster planci]